MKRLLLRWGINAVAIWAAFASVPGIHPLDESLPSLFALAFLFGLLNAVVRPVVKLLTCPLLLLTLGLGILAVNAAMFWLTGTVGRAFGIGFTVDGWVPAVLGALVVSAVSYPLSLIFQEELQGPQSSRG